VLHILQAIPHLKDKGTSRCGEITHLPAPPLKTEDPYYANRIKTLRHKLNLTQMRLIELMRVLFASVSRWENGQTKLSTLAW
jgi:DNA-binding transcriptional regulator YiaG